MATSTDKKEIATFTGRDNIKNPRHFSINRGICSPLQLGVQVIKCKINGVKKQD
jgi:hypothetical protein